LFPDFHTGGLIDVSDYRDGLRGGKVRVRADVEIVKAKLIRIGSIPFGTTTGGVMDSIVSANDKGKIKISKIEDNTAENVEILVHLPAGADAETTREALYAFTDCEVSISPNSLCHS
jgi:topoisomerase-4 subunit A